MIKPAIVMRLIDRIILFRCIQPLPKRLNKPIMTAMPPLVANTASQDSAAESLDTLTVQWTATEQRVKSIVEDNANLQQQNKALLQQLQDKTSQTTTTLSTTVEQLQTQVQAFTTHPATGKSPAENAQPIQTVPELSDFINGFKIIRIHYLVRHRKRRQKIAA